MKIESLSCFLFSTPFSGSKIRGQGSGKKTVAIIAVTVDGVEGYGECYLGIYDPKGVRHALREITRFYKSVDLRVYIEGVHNYSNYPPFLAYSGFYKAVIAAVDLALWDCYSKIFRIPIRALLTETKSGLGTRGLKKYLSGGSLASSPEEIRIELRSYSAEKYGAYKMRVSQVDDINYTTDRIEAALDCLHGNPIIFDMIAGTLRSEVALSHTALFLEFLSSYNPLWIEEPFSPMDLNSYRAISKLKTSPIAVGESFTTSIEYFAFSTLTNVGFFQIDATMLGISEIKKGAFKDALPSRISLATHTWGSVLALRANYSYSYFLDNLHWEEVPIVCLDLDRLLCEDNDSGYGWGVESLERAIESLPFSAEDRFIFT